MTLFNSKDHQTKAKKQLLNTIRKQLWSSFNDPIMNFAAQQLAEQDSVSETDVAQAIIDYAKQDKDWRELAQPAQLTPADILLDKVLIIETRTIARTLNDIKAARRGDLMGNLPSAADVQTKSGQSFKTKLQIAARPVFHDQKMQTMLRRACLAAAQDHQQSITFAYHARPVTYELASQPVLRLTIELMLALYPEFKLLDANPKHNALIAAAFEAQLEQFAMTERLAITHEDHQDMPKSEGLFSFEITLSWDTKLTLEDAVKISNLLIREDQFKRLIRQGDQS